MRVNMIVLFKINRFSALSDKLVINIYSPQSASASARGVHVSFLLYACREGEEFYQPCPISVGTEREYLQVCHKREFQKSHSMLVANRKEFQKLCPTWMEK